MDLDELPATFSYSDARKVGMSKRRLYRLRDEGWIEQLSRGVYRRSSAPAGDLDLIDIAHRAPQATLCLYSALSEHRLSDVIPRAYDIALPRGAWKPTTDAPVSWHSFDRRTFEVGRRLKELDYDTSIGLYSPERSIVDAFRLRSQLGEDVAYEALRRWLRQGGRPTDLLEVAGHFPPTLDEVRHSLTVLQ